MTAKGIAEVMFAGAVGSALIYGSNKLKNYIVDAVFGEDDDDAKYETVSQETSNLEKGKKVLTYSCPQDQDIKQLRLQLSTPNGTKIKISCIMVGGDKIQANESWIDKSNAFKILLPMPKKPSGKIKIWVECYEETTITCVVGKKCE
eukprot:14692_1